MPDTGMSGTWRLLWQDGWLRALTCWLPLLLFGWMTWLFNGGQVREMPVGLVDLDHSAYSRQLARQLDASSAMRLAAEYASPLAGSDALRAGQIYGLVLIPDDFEKQVRQGRQPTLTVFYNSQLLLVGRMLSASMQQSLGTLAAQWSVGRSLVQRPVPLAAIGIAVPLTSQLTALFNLGGNYAQFLLSGLLPALWQILILVATISLLALRASQSRTATAAWTQVAAQLCRDLVPLLLIYWAWGGIMLWWLYGVSAGALQGALWLLVLAQGGMVLACLAMGGLLFGLTRDGARAMSLAAGYSAPAFAFMGVTFPAHNMDLLARIWRNLLPVSHYTQIQIGQMNQGLSKPTTLAPLGCLLLFVLIWPLVIGLMRRERGSA